MAKIFGFGKGKKDLPETKIEKQSNAGIDEDSKKILDEYGAKNETVKSFTIPQKSPLSKLKAETGLSGKPLLKEWMKRKRNK